MAKKADIDFALNGDMPVVQQELQQTNFGDFVRDENPASSAVEQFVCFKLTNSNKKGGTYIPNIDDVVNPKTGKVERIRLLAGVDTIWLKEQKDLSPDYVRQNARSLVFPRGAKIMRIPTWDTTALEFARVCRHNVGNPDRKTGSKFEFFEYNPAKEQEEALKKELFELEMAMEAQKQPVDKMRKHAYYLGVNFVDELGNAKTDEGVRREYMLIAKRNPSLFQKTLNSKDVELNYQIKKAILDSKIDLGRIVGSAYWGTGGFIARIPQGRKPVEYLVEFATQNTDESKQFCEQLKTIV